MGEARSTAPIAHEMRPARAPGKDIAFLFTPNVLFFLPSRRLSRRFAPHQVQRTCGWRPHVLHYVRIDHRRLHVHTSQVVLNLPYVHAMQEQMCRERMPQGMDRGRLGDPCSPHRRPDRRLNGVVADMMAISE